MVKAFTFIGDLSTDLDFARFRMDDIDPQVTVDETSSPSPFLWDVTYLALINAFGLREGMAQAAETIATKISKNVTSFAEAGGIRFSLRNVAYYEQLADIIRKEPAWSSREQITVAQSGKIKRGDADSYNHYRRVVGFPLPEDPNYIVPGVSMPSLPTDRQRPEALEIALGIVD